SPWSIAFLLKVNLREYKIMRKDLLMLQRNFTFRRPVWIMGPSERNSQAKENYHVENEREVAGGHSGGLVAERAGDRSGRQEGQRRRSRQGPEGRPHQGPGVADQEPGQERLLGTTVFHCRH